MKKLESSNILVTGGTGFVGSHLVEELLQHKANIVTTFLTTNPLSYFYTQKLNKKVRMAHVDVCDYEAVFDLITKCHIDYIFHLAAQPLVETAFCNPRRTLYSNILGTVNILESARLFPNVKGVIVASSDKAYGKLTKFDHLEGVAKRLLQGEREKAQNKYVESDPLRGDHPYEVSKSSADLIAHSYFKTYHLPVVVTRFGNVYGEGDLNFSRIIPGIIRSIIRNETLEIRSNGKYVRDYLYVKDVINGYLLLASNIQKVKGEAFNFGSEETLYVLEVIKKVEKTLHKKINYKILNNAINEIPYQSLNYAKARKKIGWEPKYSIENTFKKIMSWYKKNLF